MIQRVVLIRLKPHFRDEATLAAVTQETENTLPKAHGVQRLLVGTPADSRTRGAWDLVILIHFDTIEDVETYRVDKVHRAYADVFLKPMMEKIHVFNFDLA